MDSVDTEVVKTAVAWFDAGHRATLVTVIRTWGSAPRPIGAMLVIRDDGHVIGSVSGGCVEDDLIERVKTITAAHQATGGRPEIVTYGVTADQAARFGLPCGGTLQLVLEPVQAQSQLKELLDTIERHELVARFLDMETGRVRLESGHWSDVLEFDGKQLKSIHGPRWRLLIIGAGNAHDPFEIGELGSEISGLDEFHVDGRGFVGVCCVNSGHDSSRGGSPTTLPKYCPRGIAVIGQPINSLSSRR